jgi:hypothetical protein
MPEATLEERVARLEEQVSSLQNTLIRMVPFVMESSRPPAPPVRPVPQAAAVPESKAEAEGEAGAQAEADPKPKAEAGAGAEAGVAVVEKPASGGGSRAEGSSAEGLSHVLARLSAA